jgi:predicted RNA polymerase sigma factor
VSGAAAAEEALRAVEGEGSLASYAPLHAVAAEFAWRQAEPERAASLLERALACPASEPQRRFLERRRESWVRMVP